MSREVDEADVKLSVAMATALEMRSALAPAQLVAVNLSLAIAEYQLALRGDVQDLLKMFDDLKRLAEWEHGGAGTEEGEAESSSMERSGGGRPMEGHA